MDYIKQYFADFTPQIISHGFTILIIILVAYLGLKFISIFIIKFIHRIVASGTFHSDEARQKRENTLVRIFKTTLYIVVWIVAGLMILQTLGVAIGPLLAAAGVAGLALGFGGQYLIRDIISGLFIIMENQYRIGDVICCDNTCGMVEDITLRMSTLRDLDGVVHHIPHGEIKKVSNLSKHFARVNLNVGVSYNSNIDTVIKVVNAVGEELANDPEWTNRIIKAPQFLRVDNFADSAIIIKILGDTQPLKQWEVTGELRKRLKVAFDNAGIVIPFPQRVIHHQETNSLLP